MDKSKLLLIDLIEKYKEILHNNSDYIACKQLLNKIGSSILTYNSDEVKLNLAEILTITDEEIKLFSLPKSLRIISALKELHNNPNLVGWRVNSVYQLVKELQQDILDNKMLELKKQEDSLDEVLKIIEEGQISDNYQLILDFIKISLDNKMISVTDAVNLNFYVLRECNSNNVELTTDMETEVVELQENVESPDDIRQKIVEIFNKYDYVYDSNRMGDLDFKFVKYAKMDYLEYVLSKFKEYNILPNEIYIRKYALCNIIVDNDRETFDSILRFIDENECSLLSLLAIPAVFSKRKRNYVEKPVVSSNGGNSIFEIVGANKDFLENMELYKRLAGVSTIKDIDLDRLGKFLCTSSEIVRKNLLLLKKYHIIEREELPKSIWALCGRDTEYIVDRLIELDLYESYLSPRLNRDGELKQPRGTYFLDLDKNPLKFYKMKRAKDLGQSILATNGGIKKLFTQNSKKFEGISYDEDLGIIQEQLPIDIMTNVSPEIRKELPYILRQQISDGNIPKELVPVVYFKNLYKYGVMDPVIIFAASDKKLVTSFKGERLASVFSRDYEKVIGEEESKSLLYDSFIKMLDSAVYCDEDGNYKPLKTTDLKYEFMHPEFKNIKVVISRFKVLRLCKLLKEDGCWIKSNSTNIEKENTLLSVLLKDTIISDTEMIMMRLAVRNILNNGLIKIPKMEVSTKEKRGAR